MKSILDNKYNFLSIFFIVFFIFYSIKSGVLSLAISNSEILFLKDIFNIVLIIMSLLSVLFFKERWHVLLYLSFLLLFFFNIAALNNSFYFGYLFTISLLILSSNILWTDLIKLLFISSLFSFVIIVLMSLFSEYYFINDERFGERFTAGLDNPNALAQYFIMLLNTSILFFESRIKDKTHLFVISSFVFFLIMILIYLTLSRTSLILGFFYYFLFIISMFVRYKKIYRPKLSISILFCVLIIILFQFYSAIFYNSTDVLILLNEFLSGRIWYAYMLYYSKGMPGLFWGVDLGNYLPLDFYFIHNIYGLGILPFFVLFFITIKKFFKTKMTLLMSFTILSMVIESLTETYFSVLFFSIALFIIFHKSTG